MAKNQYTPPGKKPDPYELAGWIITVQSYFVCNGMLYVWDEDKRMYRLLRRSEIPPWVLSNIDASVQAPSAVVNEAIKCMLWSPEHIKDINSVKKKAQYLLNLNNGIYDIETGSFTEGEAAVALAKESLFTYRLDFSYREGASLEDCPAFRQFVETSLDYETSKDKTTLLLEIIGICISSIQTARKFYFLVGATKSGKSVIADLLQAIMIPETGVTAFGLNQLSGRFNSQHLEYSRLNICRELTAGKITGTDTLKMIVSDEPLFVEGKGKEGYVAHIHTKLLTCSNQMPLFGEMDAAGNKSMTDRMVVLRFNHTISEENMDRHLSEKLFAERDVILSMAVDALKALHDRDYIFTVPQDTVELMESYLQESRSLAMFIEDRCQMCDKVHISSFITAYKEFCTENALVPYKNNEISAYIANCFPEVRKEKFRLNGKYLWGWNGISLNTEAFGAEIREEKHEQ